jgi:lipopolysaccharide export system permease protein
MGIVTRYLLKELLGTIVVALATLTSVFVLAGIGQEAVRMNLGLGPVARLIPFFLPQALSFSIPATALLATCVVYGRMSSANEIVAIKSMGIDPKAILRPVWGLGFVLSVLGVWINDLANSWGAQGIQRVVIQSVGEIVYGKLRTHKSYSSDGFSVVVRDVEDRTMIAPVIMFRSGPRQYTITAEQARLESNFEKETLELILVDSVIEFDDGTISTNPGEFTHQVPLNKASNRDDRTGSPAQTPLAEIGREAEKQRREVKRLEQEAAAETAISLMTGDYREFQSPAWHAKLNAIALGKSRLVKLGVEPWRRWASGFACLAFVCVGAPLAIYLRNSDFMSTFFICFAPILGCYFPLFLGAVDMAKGAKIHPSAIFVGNIVCLLVGWYYTKRVEQN